MRHNPVLGAFLVIVNLAVVLLAAYLAIDALDQSRLQSARTETSLNRLSESLDTLGERLARLQAAPAPRTAGAQSASAAPAVSPDSSGPGDFNNANLRDPEAEFGGTVVSRASVLPGHLNTLVNSDASVSAIWGYMVDSLAGRNYDDITKFEPLMAESWDVSPDGLVYTIRLRKNILWQPYTDPVTKREVPATPLTSRDFLFFWNTLQNKDIPCDPLRNYYEDMEGIEIVDDHTFTVRWKQPYSMSEECTLGMQPLPEHYYRPDPDWSDERFAEEFTSSARNQWIVGTGPYKLERWDKNLEVLLVRDENYYGPAPYAAARHIKLIPDNSVSFLEFKKGQLDSYGLLPEQWFEETPEPEFQLVTPRIATAGEDSIEWDRKKRAGELPENYRFEKYQYEGSSQSWANVVYNLQKPLFRDRETRVALTHLIDRNRILDEVALGLGTIITGPFVPRSPYYNKDVLPLPFSIGTAVEMLADAGWEDTDGDGLIDKDYDGSGERKPFEFTFIIPSSSTTTRKVAAIVEQDMAKAKIKMNIKPIEWSVFTQLLDNREFDVCFLAWYGGIEGDPYQLWHGAGAAKTGSSNHAGYDSPEANRLIEEGRRTIDKEKRYEIYRKLHAVIARDQPYTFLYAPAATLAQSKRFRNAIVYKGGQMSSLLQWIPAAGQEIR